MSTAKQAHDELSHITEDDVADWLRVNPDFFERHQALLASLRLPHSTGGPAVSLVERQVAMLRQKNLKIERKFTDLVDVARANELLATKTHNLCLDLLAERGLVERIGIVESALRTSFNAEQAVLVLFDAKITADEAGRFVRIASRNDEALAPFATFLASSTPRCGHIRDSQRDYLFGEDTVEIGSAALVPLGEKSATGFLAIGSRDADYFHPGKSLDFLGRLGELLGCALRSG
jgi:uncharacterized protein YigA (DUF484 family)